MKINKFVIVGVESTGKSMCAIEVARYFNAILITEYARDYLEVNSNDYNYQDFIKIARGQAEKEDEAIKNPDSSLLIFDTDFIVICIWAKIVFNRVEHWISQRTARYTDRTYFLMSPEVEWINDGLREYPDREIRDVIHQNYIKLLDSYGYEYYIIGGTEHKERIRKVIEIIEKKIQS